MEQEVHVEAPGQGFVRLSPLGNHGRLGKLLGQKAADLLPQGHSAFALRVLPNAVRPGIAVGKVVALRPHGLPEPGVLHGGMPENQVQQNVHFPVMDLLEQALWILVGAVAGGSPAVVRHA